MRSFGYHGNTNATSWRGKTDVSGLSSTSCVLAVFHKKKWVELSDRSLFDSSCPVSRCLSLSFDIWGLAAGCNYSFDLSVTTGEDRLTHKRSKGTFLNQTPGVKVTSTDQFNLVYSCNPTCITGVTGCISSGSHDSDGHAVICRAHWRVHAFHSSTVYLPAVEINTEPFFFFPTYTCVQ